MSLQLRERLLQNLENTPFDLIIVGGGINGAGILRDATLRGLKAILIEQNEFASGTSSKSSKLIHGGLRYLETFDWKLVFEACQERKILLRVAPSLVKPLPFLYPVYKGVHRNLFEVAAGMFLYDALALFRNISHPHIYGAKKTLELEPRLKPNGLSGSGLYYDAVTNDTQLTLSNIHAAERLGGLAFHFCSVQDLIETKGSISGIHFEDSLTQKKYSLHSKWVVNVTGPWSDQFVKKNVGVLQNRLRLTKGVHLILPKSRFPLSRALLLHAPQDKRVTFAIPWEEKVLVGTTDTDFTGNPDSVTADKTDVKYLLEISNFYFPNLHLTEGDVQQVFAGLRPLLADDRKGPSQTSREHKIIFEKPGLVTLTGGKLTTFRKMSKELLDQIIAKEPLWKSRVKKCSTAVEHLS